MRSDTYNTDENPFVLLYEENDRKGAKACVKAARESDRRELLKAAEKLIQIIEEVMEDERSPDQPAQ